MIRKLFIALAFCFALPIAANAACNVASGVCFWIGGDGTMNLTTDSAHWSTASGGSSCSCEPTSTSQLIFDGGSGAGTGSGGGAYVTFGPGTITAGTLTITGTGQFTGTWDASVNNTNVTMASGVSFSGTGTRKILMGTGTWTVGTNASGGSATWSFLTTTGLDATSVLNTAPIVLVSGSIGSGSLFFGGKTWGPLTITGSSSWPSSKIQIESGTNANDTFASLTINAPAWISSTANQTYTFTGGITVNGASWAAPVYWEGNNAAGTGGNTTIAVGAASNMNFGVFRNVVGATSTITANPGVNLGGNSGTLTITNPGTGGGGGFIIGG